MQIQPAIGKYIAALTRTRLNLSSRGAQRRGNLGRPHRAVRPELVEGSSSAFSLNEIANPRIEYGVAMTKWVRVSIAVGLLASVLIVGNSGCSDLTQPSANAQYARPYDVVVDGAVDEFIGPTGPTAPDFVDSAYHQLRRPDDIPPVYDPMFVDVAAANLQDDELVIGLVVNGDARAYPLGILYNREMVNDVWAACPCWSPGARCATRPWCMTAGLGTLQSYSEIREPSIKAP